MKGRHHIVVETERLKYEFDIRRNLTVIQGDSATGKTTLIEILQQYGRHGASSGVRLQSDVNCAVFSGDESHWAVVLSELRQTVVFFDEDYAFICSKEFADFIRNTDNYYVFITRRSLWNLPYSINEIYGIRTSGKYHFPEQVYHEFYPIYQDAALKNSDQNVVLLLEDAKAGFQFFTRQVDAGIQCVSAEGNGNILRCLSMLEPERQTVIIADGAAFGAFMQKTVVLMETRGNTSLYLPECFEWLILKSGILQRTDIDTILRNPADYIDSTEFFSWEQYFTFLLEECTRDDSYRRYSKSKLSEFYQAAQNARKIASVLPEQIQELLQSKNDK